MNNPMITSPSNKTEQEIVNPAHKGIYLVSRNRRPVPTPAQNSPSKGLTLAKGRTSEASQPAEVLEARSAEIFRLKLAACFGGVLSAPIVWCLHTVVLSLHTR